MSPEQNVNHVPGKDQMVGGAGRRIRTADFLITNEALYQLSYTGIANLKFTLNSLNTAQELR